MAKLADVKNPLRKEVNILNPKDWIGSILYVAWLGMVFVLGVKLLMKADEVIPGNNTPNYFKNTIAQPKTEVVQVL